MTRKYLIPAGLLVWMGIAGYAVHRMPHENRVGFSAPLELWADALRDASALAAPPEEQERQIGTQLAPMVVVVPPSDPSLQPYVDRVGAKIATHARRKEIMYKFTVREDSTLNAFALPGGWIFVNTGLLQFLQSEDELAVVIGHEVSHIELRHTSPNHIRSVLSLGYTKYQEFDADEAGVRLAARAGYNPQAAVTLFGRLGAQTPSGSPVGKAKSPVREAGGVLMHTLGTYWHSHPENAERSRRVSHTIGKSN